MISKELQDLFAQVVIAQAKTDAQLAKTDAQLAKTDARLAELYAEQSRSQTTTRDEVAETTRVMREVSKRLGNMGQNQGDVAEAYFYNSLVEKPKLGEIKFDFADFHQLRGKKGKQHEVDIRLVNGKSVALIEVKYKAHINDLAQIEEQVKQYRSFYPEHKNFEIYAGIAALSIPSDVAKAAKEMGYFVLQRKGEVFSSDTKAMRAF